MDFFNPALAMSSPDVYDMSLGAFVPLPASRCSPLPSTTDTCTERSLCSATCRHV
jgi:hypothetical protein